MAPLSLSARPRTQTGRHAASVRRAGSLPAVLYGHRVTTTPVELDYRAAQRAWARAGRTTLLDLEVEGGQRCKVIFREVQVHPRSGRLLHADLFAPNLRINISAEVPLVLTGEAPAVATKQGVLLQVANSLKVECLPTDLPHQVSVDVSGLEATDSLLTAGEVQLPERVTLLSDPGEVVAKIASLRVRDLDLPASDEGGEGGADADGDQSGADES